MNGDSRAALGDDLFRLQVDGLAKLVGRCVARSAFAADVGGYLNWWAVGEGIQT